MTDTNMQQQPDQQGQVVESSDFSLLLNKEFKPKSDRAKAEVENAVQTLAQYVLKDTSVVSDDAIASISAVIFLDL